MISVKYCLPTKRPTVNTKIKDSSTSKASETSYTTSKLVQSQLKCETTPLVWLVKEALMKKESFCVKQDADQSDKIMRNTGFRNLRSFLSTAMES